MVQTHEQSVSLAVRALVGWAMGTLVRRYGGLKLYHTSRPAFLGTAIGGYVLGGVFALVSTVFGIRQPEWGATAFHCRGAPSASPTAPVHPGDGLDLRPGRARRRATAPGSDRHPLPTGSCYGAPPPAASQA
jgi:hypothetical protein